MKKIGITKMKAAKLKPPRHGARPRDVTVEDVRASIARHGQLQPVVVERDGTVILGDQRRRSLRPTDTVEVMVVDADEISALEMRLSEEYAKTEQSAAERADMIATLARLLEQSGKKVTPRMLAAVIGTSERSVQRYLRLAKLPKAVKAMVTKGELGYKEAEALSESSGLNEEEKTGLAKKFASGAAPGWIKARDVVRFTEHAPKPVRERLVNDRRTTFDDAQRAAERSKSKEYRAWLDEQTAMRARPFFIRVIGRLRSWTPALRDVAGLAALVPGTERLALRKALTDLRDAASNALEAMDVDDKPARPALKLLERAEANLTATGP